MTKDDRPDGSALSEGLGVAPERELVERLRRAAAKKWPDSHPAQPYSLFSQAADELEKWLGLQDPRTLHAALLRGLPAQLTREQFIDLAGNAPANQKEGNAE